MRFTITPLGGSGRTVAKIVSAVVRYLRTPTPAAAGPSDDGRAGPERYYADRGEGPGRWLGRGSAALGLAGEVAEDDFARVLAGRHPRTDERLVTAQGSAGRRPRLGAGTHGRVSPDGEPLYGHADVAVTLGVTVAETVRMTKVGYALAGLAPQPPGSYLVPVTVDDQQWVTQSELDRCLAERAVGTTAEQAAATGEPDDVLPLAEAARIAGTTPRYLRRLARRYETNRPAFDDAVAAGRDPRLAYLVAPRGPDRRWLVRRGDLTDYLARRRPPAVRVGYDLTLTTEKSLGVLALLSPPDTGRRVLDAIQDGNDLALGWLEQNAAAARERGQVVPVRGWTVASFRHHTSRALDPFPHHHNVVANTVEATDGTRRTLDARHLYRHAQAASSLATVEMRYQLTRRLGVRWRPGRTSWEVAGIPDAVLHEFSRRRTEIEDALRELEEAIGRGTSLDEVDSVILATRPTKASTPVDQLVARWWDRAGALGFDPADLAACTGRAEPPGPPEDEAVFAALARPDGLCENLSIFDRGDVLTALAQMPNPSATGDVPEPILVPAGGLERLADAFLTSDHVVALPTPDGTEPSRFSTTEMLAVQRRVVDRYRHGLHQGAALTNPDALDHALASDERLTAEQRQLVTAFCTSGHRIQCAVGRPGAGKTTAMAAARRAWEAAGWRVLGAAVKGEAARNLQDATGIPAETLAWYLAHDDPLDSPLDARTVLVVDEASTSSDRDLDRLGWLAAATGATLRLIGDPAQHGAVEAGGMFRVLCERHPDHTPELTIGHRLLDPHDAAAADALRAGDIAEALRQLDAAGHLHVVDDELDAHIDVVARWWAAHRNGDHHPMVDRRNTTRRTLNRLAHALRHAHGELGPDHLTASDDRRFATGDHVIARAPDRHLHPPGDRSAYVRNGATGTITAIRHGPTPADDTLVVDFTGIATIDIPRTFFDPRTDRPEPGLDHAYAVTSWAVQSATNPVSTSRIDPAATRAEAYVDITRGRHANHLYLTRPPDPLDGEALPRTPPDPLDDQVTTRLTASTGERTAWELLHPPGDHQRQPAAAGVSLP